MSARATIALSVDCSFGYGSVLGTIKMQVHPGELIVLTGSNGSGKSTLISTLAGELDPIDGSVKVVHTEGNSLGDPATPSVTGCVTRIADPSFFPDLTLSEHVDLISRKVGIAMDTLLERTLPWKIVDLPNTLASQLSSGQRQRANLALQLAVTSRVVVLDEPERHLDTEWTQVLRQQLRLLAQRGIAVIAASHSPILIDAADKVIRL